MTRTQTQHFQPARSGDGRTDAHEDSATFVASVGSHPSGESSKVDSPSRLRLVCNDVLTCTDGMARGLGIRRTGQVNAEELR